MRVIAGQLKSRLIKSPKGVDLRPTSDRVKESLFGILAGSVIGKNVLDLFSGTGNLGIEALSRGAESCVFVDSNPRCTTAIKKNLEAFGIEEKGQVLLKDSFKFIRQAQADGLVFDLIFLDPPYYNNMTKKCLILLDNYNIINFSTTIITEHYKMDELPQPAELKELEICRQGKYGGTILSFYRSKQR